ncbi:hypothetical protein D9619_001497 [Psilocybe cf. subviscida]|uniref:Coenzyme Q-binding protein COQ10 START domain-containing protein n=1 Tax=Psilocybe cf. subviscida TaxID=2480587 RepID=A0A8H5BDG5_9AGAR|nr:hypothetical protein D9619_001497 [Psilocybe cf. subviscida]
MHRKIFAAILLFVCTVIAQTPPTNLPPSAPGAIFEGHANILINAPIQKAWDVLLDFPSYPEWNPFVRKQTVTNALYVPLNDQTPQVNLRLIIEAQIPPLPSPVTATTPPNLLHEQHSFENITVVDRVRHRVAWKQIMIPDALLTAERWQGLSEVEGGGTYYESREAFYGPLAVVVGGLMGTGLQEGFSAQAAAFKVRVESLTQ